MSLDDVWNVAKPLLEMGGLGAVLYVVIRFWGHTQQDLKASQEARIESERSHAKDLLQLERRCNEQVAEIVRQQDMTLASVESTMKALGEKVAGRSD